MRRIRGRRVAPLPLAGALLSLAAVIVGIVWIISSSGAPSTRVRASAATTAPRTPVVHRSAARRHPAAAKPKPKPVARTHTVATPPPPSADSLEAQGHALLYSGQIQASIPVLRRALAAASPSSLTYAYALFDLAHALRLSGEPRAAVPLLVARLKIPNQIDKVKAELVLALHAIAAQSGPSGGATVTPPAPGAHGRGHDKHGGDQAAPPATSD